MNKNYMPQDIFNMSAVVVASYTALGDSIEDSAKLISDDFHQDYIDDGFEEDIITAAYDVMAQMEKAFPEKGIMSVCRQIQYCITNYHPSGEKILLKGAIFNQQKTPLPNRVSQCRKDIMTFHFGTLSGIFPLHPKDWSL